VVASAGEVALGEGFSGCEVEGGEGVGEGEGEEEEEGDKAGVLEPLLGCLWGFSVEKGGGDKVLTWRFMIPAYFTREDRLDGYAAVRESCWVFVRCE
jgi:hypothetical protein